MGERPADLCLHCFQKMMKDEILSCALCFIGLNMVIVLYRFEYGNCAL